MNLLEQSGAVRRGVPCECVSLENAVYEMHL